MVAPEGIGGDSAVTRAEKVERNGGSSNTRPRESDESELSPTKRARTDVDPVKPNGNHSGDSRRKGEAPIKKEYLIRTEHTTAHRQGPDDDAAEAAHHVAQGDGKIANKKKNRGQNKARKYGQYGEEQRLCATRSCFSEFSPAECKFGADCRFEHDLRKYLEGKTEDITALNAGICPIWDLRGFCPAGWKCRFFRSHSNEIEHGDGRKELILTEDEQRKASRLDQYETDDNFDIVNVPSVQDKQLLSRKRWNTPKSDKYTEWLSKLAQDETKAPNRQNLSANDDDQESTKENRASYRDPPFLPSEKRRIYYGPETPVLAPLTTQGNLPFRRLCVSLGAEVTWSEMAMGMPLIQGEKGEWALMKAHKDELVRPAFRPRDPAHVVAGYDNAKDFKFGAQIAANKPWLACKTAEVITALCPHLRAIDVNCGCPIDLVYRQGAGSALLDVPSKLEKMVRGMHAVSNEVPITVKIRTGVRDDHPNADKLIGRLVLGGEEARKGGGGGSGVAAITLHGRSRQQRYTKLANWTYISECAALIDRYNKEADQVADTEEETEARQQANGGKVYFVGNGDCYSHKDYFDHIEEAKVDSVMVGRGALIKPWVFEEISTGQYLDKSSSQRLEYIEKFCRNGLEAWGSDELGVGTTRRFLLEWLSFSCRYIPIGLLERLPPAINERPPAFRGRDDLETLMASDDYRDWIKISEMFLGKTNPNFHFQPKHKSNAYEEVEG